MAIKRKRNKLKLIVKLDQVFSQWIRRRNGEFATCVTCGKTSHWKNMQAGHFMSRRHMSTRWNEDNVQVQCASCNVFKQGEQYLFSLYLGKEKSDELLELSRQLTKFTEDDILEMTDYYKKKIKELEQ